MLNLHFAPSTKGLVPVLLEKLRTEWTDPFRPPAIIVPSPAVGKWLQLRLADLADCPAPAGRRRPQALGCTANLEMPTLERFLWKALQPSEKMRLLDAAVLQQAVCAQLTAGLLEKQDYKSVRSYLMNDNGTIDPVKKVQLASRIARQFQEYEFNRPSVWEHEKRAWKPGMDAKWLNDKTYCDGDENELWQKDLYCRAHKSLGRASPFDDVNYISLPHLYRLRREKGLEDKSRWTVPEGSMFLFGVSKVSHFHRNTLVEISQMTGIDMHVFLTNPCAEFWEDVDTRRSRRGLRRSWRNDSRKEDAGIAARSPADYEKEELKEIAQLPRDHALLELWGNAGKADIFLWCAQAQWNFEYYSPAWVEEEKDPETLLKAVQYSLLRCQNELKGVRRWDDGSLQVLAGPDPAREVEELREQVLDLVESGRVKSLNEIAVYLPDPSAYVSQIQRVFGAFGSSDPAYIPWSVLGAPGSDSLFSQGMRALLEIAEGRFDRAHVFALLCNPIVQSTHNIPPDDVSIWEGWAEELGIFRGYDRKHREDMGDRGQAITDAHTFGLGIARLLIGTLAADPVEMKYRFCAGDEDSAASAIPAFRDFDTSDDEIVERFCGLVEDLYNDAERLRKTFPQTSLSGAVDVITGIAWDWFGTVPDDTTGSMAAEGRVRNEFLETLQAITVQDRCAEREGPVEFREFLALVRECLPEELPAGSRAWTGGITFAPLRPAMVVPHRVIFALGLDATAFPGTGDRPGWDLLSRRRIVGDSDRVRDNRFAFLELLHAAQERLVLSFRGRDMQKEEERQPSSVVLELESYLKSQGLKTEKDSSREEQCLIRREIPWIIRESLEDVMKTGRCRGTWDPAESRLAHIERMPDAQKAAYRYGTAAGTPRGSAARDTVRTSVNDLRRFFANPLEYHLSKTLGIELDERPAVMGATDEPLESGALEMSVLQKTIWSEVLLRVFPEHGKDACAYAARLAEEAETIAARVHHEQLVQGLSPEAQFYAIEEQRLKSWARSCAETTLDLRATFGDHWLVQGADFSLKRPGFPGGLTVDIGDGRKCAVECRHALALVPRGGAGTIGIIGIKKEGDAKENPDLWLAGALQWLADRKNGSRQDIMLVQLNRGDTGSSFSAMKKQCDGGRDMEQWLGGFIRAMIVERSSDHLPFAIVRELCGLSDDSRLDLKRVTKGNIEELLSGEHSPYRCSLEAFTLVDARIPDASDEKLQERVLARFAPMLEGWIHG
jgi:exonuclease V gamma subunit